MHSRDSNLIIILWYFAVYEHRDYIFMSTSFDKLQSKIGRFCQFCN